MLIKEYVRPNADIKETEVTMPNETEGKAEKIKEAGYEIAIERIPENRGPLSGEIIISIDNDSGDQLSYVTCVPADFERKLTFEIDVAYSTITTED